MLIQVLVSIQLLSSSICSLLSVILSFPCHIHLSFSLFHFQKPYINQSALSISETFSLQRTNTIFRTLGLRHLTVVDSRNIVKGIITRKDLMGFSMQEKLTNKAAIDL